MPLPGGPACRESRGQEVPCHCPGKGHPTHVRRQEVAIGIATDLKMGVPFSIRPRHDEGPAAVAVGPKFVGARPGTRQSRELRA